LIPVLPFSKEAEDSALAACLASDTALDYLLNTCSSDDFHIPSNNIVFKTIQKLYTSGKAVDRTTIINELKNPSVKEAIDVLLHNTSYNEDNINAYCDILIEKSRLRVASKASAYIQDMLTVQDEVGADLILEQSQEILDSAYKRETEDSIKLPEEILEDTYNIIKAKMYNKDTNVIGIPTHIAKLDRLFYGFEKQTMTVLAGRPSMGKTEFAIQVCTSNALNGIKSIFFSLEQSRQELMERIITNVTEISLGKIHQGFLGKPDVQALEAFYNKIKSLPILIDAPPSLNVSKLTAKLRKAKREHPDLQMMFLDYIQLMDLPGRASRNEEIGRISKTIRQLGKSLDLAVIPLSQLSRKCDERENKRPLLSDLRDSGEVEQDADKIIFMYSDFPYTKKDEDLYTGEIIVAKHRNGPVGKVQVTNNKIIQKFYDAEDVSPESIGYSHALQVDTPEQEEDDLPF